MEEENTSCDDDGHHHHFLIPQDVLIQILVLLPVISLLRFKSVCKSWRVLIQSSLFIDLHLNTTNTITNNNFGTFIFQTSDNLPPLPSNNIKFGSFIYQTSDNLSLKEEKKTEAFMLSAASGGGGEDEDNEFEKKLLKLEALDFPSRYKFFTGSYSDHIFMVGSCNGLICIHDQERREVSLWNPATRQFRILPQSLTSQLVEEEGMGIPAAGYLVKDFAAFGYDVKTKDYKVVQISHFRPYNNRRRSGSGLDNNRWFSVKDYIFRVQVYSSSTDSWRLLEDINSFPALPRQTNRCNHGVYLKNGSYYFLGAYYIDSKPTLMLLSFDFTKEIFTTIQLPHAHHLTTILTSFGEKQQLAVFARRLAKEGESDFVPYDVWVLNEHHGSGRLKEEELWTKLHSIRLNYTQNYIRGIPRSISNNGEFALIYTEGYRVINGVHVSNYRWLQLFNLVTHQVKKEFQTGTVIRAEVYKQSLVSIGGNNDTTTADRVIGAEEM